LKEYNIFTSDDNLQELEIENIIKDLKNKEIGIIPTDTIYGIIGIASGLEVKNKIYQIKNRDSAKNLIIQIGTNYNLKKIVSEINVNAEKLMKKFFPGQLTLIFQPSKEFIQKYNWDIETIGIRIPNHSLFLKILNRLEEPVFVTSANISGNSVSSNIDELKEIFKDKIDFIVNDNKNYSVIPSTIVDVTGHDIKILREGVIKSDDIYKSLMGK
jgi:L-threonylcarbamoyladenylate synthase